MHCMFVEGKPRTIFYPPDALITAFVAMVQKITTYALAAHDPGSAQDVRMSNNFCTPGMHLFLLTLTSMQRTADETIILMMVMLEMIMVMMGVMRIMVVMMGVMGVMGVTPWVMGLTPCRGQQMERVFLSQTKPLIFLTAAA